MFYYRGQNRNSIVPLREEMDQIIEAAHILENGTHLGMNKTCVFFVFDMLNHRDQLLISMVKQMCCYIFSHLHVPLHEIYNR